MSDFTSSKVSEGDAHEGNTRNTSNARSNSSIMSDVRSCSEWRERVSQIQRQKMTPEAFEALKEKAERQKRATRAYKTAHILERCDRVSRRAQETSLMRTFHLANSDNSRRRGRSPSPSEDDVMTRGIEPPQREQEYGRVASKNSAQTSTVRSVMSSRREMSNRLHQRATDAPRSMIAMSSAPAPMENDDEDEERNYAALSAQLDAVEEDVAQDEIEMNNMLPVAFSAGGGVHPVVAPVPEGFAGLLETLAVEPSDPTEVTTKFAIFENYLETVVSLREQTIEFWQSNRSQFEGEPTLQSVMTTIDRSIRNIDQESSMAIFEGHSSRWFVYYMMNKAHQNHEAISNTLQNIRSKLELLTQEDIDCPFCLDSVGKESDCVVLGCCHKTCRPCWTNWQELKGMNAFCPLCRHEEFIQSIVAEDS